MSNNKDRWRNLMPRINIVSGKYGRDTLALLRDDHIPARLRFTHCQAKISASVRRCSQGFTLTGGLCLEATHQGRTFRRRLKPGWSMRQAETRLAYCISDAMDYSHRRRAIDSFAKWFESQNIPDKILDEWEKGACPGNGFRNNDDRPIVFEDMDDGDRDYWRAKIHNWPPYAHTKREQQQ